MEELEKIRAWCVAQYQEVDRFYCDDYDAGQHDALELLVAMIDSNHFEDK